MGNNSISALCIPNF